MTTHNTHENKPSQEDDTSAYLSQGSSEAMHARMANLGEMLRKIMVLKKWNQTRLAKEIGVAQPTISRTIKGTKPEYDNRLKMIALARQLGLIDDATEASHKGQGVRIVATVGVGGLLRKIPDKEQPIAQYPLGHAAQNLKAARVEGNGMMPELRDGYTIYWNKAHEALPVAREAIGSLCVVCLIGGQQIVRTAFEGRTAGHFDLHAVNDSPLLNQAIEWIAKVAWILPS